MVLEASLASDATNASSRTTKLDVSRLWVHGLFVSKEDLECIDPDWILRHCPSLKVGGFPVNAWRTKNLNIVLGTDSASCNDGINVNQSLFGAADSCVITMVILYKIEKTDSVSNAKHVQTERQVIFDMRAPYITPEKLLASVWGNAGNLHPQLPLAQSNVADLQYHGWDAQHLLMAQLGSIAESCIQ